MKKVLFVCLGNICRSPLAEALFMKQVEESGFADKFTCDSCGTADYNIGGQADARSVENARRNGLIYTHVGRQFSHNDFKEFDYIIAMDERNLEHIKQLNNGSHKHIYKMGDFDLRNIGADVPDPYYGGVIGFQNVFDMLDITTLHLLKQLIKG